MKKTKPLVSICCATYNHEPYIETALKGFLKQKCDFEYEILIHDDASTDKTAEIIRKYEKLYPDKIFPIYQTENQYSQGKKYSDLNYERARGKYIAICEGDDCWIDKNKLAIQIEAMQKHKKCAMSFHSAICINLEKNTIDIISEYDDKNSIVPVKTILLKKYGLIPYASVVIKKSVMDVILKYKNERPYLTVGDLYVHFFSAINGGILYVHKTMSLYRFLAEGSWTKTQRNNFQKMTNHANVVCNTYKELNKMTNYKYSKYFQLSMILRVFYLLNFKIDKMPDLFYEYQKIIKQYIDILNSRKDKYIIYGAGTGCKFIMQYLDNKKIKFILDGDRTKYDETINNISIFRPETLENYKNEKIIISLVGREKRIQNTLMEKYGIPKKNIIYFSKLLINAQLV